MIFSPTVSSNVYSGGPITEAVYDAIVDMFDDLGPANPVGRSYGTWQGSVRLSRLFETVQTVPGVLDSTIVTPLVNTEPEDPAYPENETVALLIPGKVIIRSA